MDVISAYACMCGYVDLHAYVLDCLRNFFLFVQFIYLSGEEFAKFRLLLGHKSYLTFLLNVAICFKY